MSCTPPALPRGATELPGIGIDVRALNHSSYAIAGVLDDPFAFDFIKSIRANPERLWCGNPTDPWVRALSQDSPPSPPAHAGGPITAIVRDAVRYLGAAEPRAHTATTPTFDKSMQALCAVPGPTRCSTLPAMPTHTRAFVHRFAILVERAAWHHRAMHRARAQQSASWWYRFGGNHLTSIPGLFGPDINHPLMREMLLIPTHQRAMHDIAVAIVALVESTRWDDIQAEQSQFRLQTPLGAMVFRGRADDVEADPSEDTLLLRVDLGGNDRYWG
ncbi:MAG: hypothetical protein AAF493_27720, partial [Pseudomonadota bacterium]